jgi:tetratricopeptide (TPR) repeat protein
MMQAKDLVTVLLVTSLLSFLPGCATPPTKEASASGLGASQLWLTIDEVELTITARVRLVISVDGAPDIFYPTRQVWSDGQASERFPLPMGRSRYTFQFKAMLFDGTRTIATNASESFTFDSSQLPITRQYIRLYPANSKTWGQGALARLVFSVGQDTQSQESSPSSPMTVEEIIARLELQRDYHELNFGETFPAWEDMDADVSRAHSDLATRLMAQPLDTQTLLLWARLRAGDGADSLPTPEAALDRVLAAEPHNAEALYHKGRIYGAPVWAGNKWAKRNDLVRAVSFLRQAVEFAPNNLKYRKALALFLADQGHAGEAKSILSAVSKNDPMVKFLEELDSVPIPEGAEYFFDHSLRGAYLLALMEDGGFEDYLHLRVRLYRISRSPAEIGAFYATRIPGFKFIRVNENPRDAQNAERQFESEYAQFLRMKSGVMRPSRILQELPDPQKRESGILMSLAEMRNDPSLQRKLGPGEHNCYLLLVNSRK